MSWSFQPVGGVWFTAVVAAVLLGLVWVVPRPRPEGRRLWVLRGLRLLAVMLVLAALARPTLMRTETKPLEATLLVLVDASRSMRVGDSLAGDSRWDAARRMLDDSADALRDLAEKWDLRAYRFGDRITEATIADGRIALKAEADGDASALGAALDDLLEQGGGERLLGVVLLSDGAQRALPPRDTAPPLAAQRLVAEGVPLFTATFGQPGSGDRVDAAIEDLAASESAFVKAPTAVTGRVRSTGLAGRELLVQLLWEDADGAMEVVDAQRIKPTQGGGGRQAFRLEHTPTEPGERKLSVRVVEAAKAATADSNRPPPPIAGELIRTNNEQSTFLTVRDGGVKVLYLVGAKRVGGAPGLEQRFVRAALAASPDIAVRRRVFDYRQRRQPLPPADPAGPPDVIVLDDLDASALSREAWEAVAAGVRSGVGLAMLGGAHSFGPGGYRDNPLADVLPVGIGPAERQPFGEELRRDVQLAGPLRLRPTARFGAGHPILQVSALELSVSTEPRSNELWNELPPLDGANRLERTRLKPNAFVLAEGTPEDASANGRAAPLLVVGQSGAGRTLAMAGDSTWRWRLEGFGEAHRRFWRQAILWLAQKDNATQDPVWVKLDSRRVPRGGRLDLRLGVRQTGEPIAGPVRYEAVVQTPDGRTVDLATGAGPETTALVGDTTTPGDYTVVVEAFAGDTSTNEELLGQAEARFAVPDQDLELDNPAAEPSLMAQLAATTSSAGGRAIAPEELPALFREFADREPDLQEEVLARVTYWDTWPFFLLLVGLLGTEWFLRKRWGLV